MNEKDQWKTLPQGDSLAVLEALFSTFASAYSQYVDYEIDKLQRMVDLKETLIKQNGQRK